MDIRPLTGTDINAWDAYVLNHSEGFAYHQCAWKEAVERAYGFPGIYLMAEKAGCLCGVLPLVDFKLPLLGRILVSLPYCDVGGVLADNREIAVALIDHAMQLVRSMGAKGLELRNGREQMPSPLLRLQNPAPLGNKVRMILDLPESSEALLAGLRSKLRSQVNKPMRDGLTAKLGGLELGEEFYRVFCENMRDLGSPVHSFKWVQSVLSAYGERARVGVVRLPDGTSAAAGIILLHGDKVSIPWASSLRRFNSLNPNMLLYWTFLSFAADNGFRRFDFGRSTPAEGTYRFKEQWGAQPHPLFWYELTTSGCVAKSSSQVEGLSGRPSNKRQLVANLWSRLPEAGANWLGPRIRKYISL